MSRTIPVTVVIPNYNSGAYLVECVESINRGTRPEQIVIVDDVSTDGSDEVASHLASEYGNVEVVRRDENGGAVEARRTGVKRAACDWIALVDADDTVEEGAVAAAFDRVLDTGCDLCVWQLWKTDGERLWHLVPLDPADFPMTGREAARRTLGGWQMHPLGLARKSLYADAYAGFREPGYNADELLTRRVLLRATAVGLCNKKYFYRLNPSSTSVGLHRHRVDVLDSQRWLVRFTIENFSRPDVIRAVEVAIGTGWATYQQRRALGTSEVRRRMSGLMTELGHHMQLRDWPRMRPGHIVAYIFLRTWSRLPTGGVKT
ncbi:glycosyltransferase family 2 protein [Rubrivirga sp. S365]|uniref:Glycosyltransferase family 2 protein n=1 Tax=Rubrivirga litoralis TaxID=3075598 RepID=A0ABU3BRA0_9BACT|nr:MULTISPECIES: glycosyltransferase family 2 protein [unclassified Rubrivirga]MDT0631813.1 glycosyltransferase family 2 protein [Rubrivirga sp. F394]MDT7856495.1 glycosyltransferase family 2 protein [Rubrivirga sp. S365]